MFVTTGASRSLATWLSADIDEAPRVEANPMSNTQCPPSRAPGFVPNSADDSARPARPDLERPSPRSVGLRLVLAA